MRNNDGTFSRGNRFSVGPRRPEGAGKAHLKDMGWKAVETVARLIFDMPEPEMRAWFEANKHTLSVAERIYIEQSDNIEIVETLLDRVVGKTLKVDAEVFERNPLLERLYTLSPEALSEEIEELREPKRLSIKRMNQLRAGLFNNLLTGHIF